MSDSFEQEASRQFEGPVDDYGEPKISNDPMDIEVRFPKDPKPGEEPKPILYRFYFESATNQAYCGKWRESRSEAYADGQRWLKEGRL